MYLIDFINDMSNIIALNDGKAHTGMLIKTLFMLLENYSLLHIIT